MEKLFFFFQFNKKMQKISATLGLERKVAEIIIFVLLRNVCFVKLTIWLKKGGNFIRVYYFKI